MSRQIQIRRGTSAEHNNFTGAIGEITMDTTNKTLRVHDGTTVGGHEILKKNEYYSHISNCITNIPQNIKLTLNNGTLTLKSGSTVYVPNGAGVFDAITIANDMSITPSYGTQSNIFVFLNAAHTGLTIEGHTNCYSGDTAPTLGVTYANWYDTENNIMKRTTDGGNSWLTSLSLPVATITSTSNVITNIDQTFNGFGYIGSTAFVLPGVSVATAAGITENGTLNSTPVTISNVQINTSSLSQGGKLLIKSDGTIDWALDYSYNPQNNRVYNSGQQNAACVAELKRTTNGKVSNLNPYMAFHAVDYSDTEFITHQTMPSNKHTNLTLGATGTTYAAPADGYYAFNKWSGNAGERISLQNQTAGIFTDVWSFDTNESLQVYVPVSKGDITAVSYNASGNTDFFRFVYANGSK